MSPAEIHARRNAVDPVNPSNFLRKSESLTMARVHIDQLRMRLDDTKNAARLVHEADKPAFLELLNVASQALDSAGNIIDTERDRIAREVNG
jgi:hypothetical protein